MPFYTYKCDECGEIFEIFHGMDEQLCNCIACESDKSLKKIPTDFLSSLKKNNKSAKIGSLVESHIKEAKKDLLEEKKKLKNKTYD